MADTSEPKLTTDPSQVAGLGLTPVYANRFSVTLNPVMTRIAVGEFVAGKPETDSVYHTVIVAPTSDAVALANLILEIARHVKVAEVLAHVPPPKSGENDAKR
jgi:hypothetical protein